MRERVKILGIPIDILTMEKALARIEGFIQAGGSHQVVTANAEMVMLAQQDEEFREILFSADLVSGDGAGVVWASKKVGQPLPERVTGVDLVNNLLPIAASRGYSFFLFGGAPGIAEEAAVKMKEKFPGLKIVGVENGYFQSKDEQTIVEKIQQAKPQILLVALGVPKQEKWAKKHLANLGVPVVIGVGGTLDVFSGRVLRAPLWIQKINLEWFYRLSKEPKRFFRIMALPKFVFRVLGSTGKRG